MRLLNVRLDAEWYLFMKCDIMMFIVINVIDMMFKQR